MKINSENMHDCISSWAAGFDICDGVEPEDIIDDYESNSKRYPDLWAEEVEYLRYYLCDPGNFFPEMARELRNGGRYYENEESIAILKRIWAVVSLGQPWPLDEDGKPIENQDD